MNFVVRLISLSQLVNFGKAFEMIDGPKSPPNTPPIVANMAVTPHFKSFGRLNRLATKYAIVPKIAAPAAAEIALTQKYPVGSEFITGLFAQ